MFLSANIAQRSPTDDFWYYPVGQGSKAGVRVSSRTAMALSAFYACVQVLSQTLGQVPCVLYKRLPKGGKERAVKHPLYRLMHMRPNAAQSAFQWKQMKMGHIPQRGNTYSRIFYRPDGEIDSLWPMHPDRVRVEYLDNSDRWNYRYKVKPRSGPGPEETLLPAEVLHLRGLATDGMVGLSPLDVQRESLGEAIAAQDYSSRLLRNDARPVSGWIKHPAHFKDKIARQEFRESFQESQTGENRGKLAVLEYGMEFKELGMKNVDLQFIEGRKQKDVDIARMHRMPLHKIGILDRATHSNIEQEEISFVTNTMLAWFVNWEQELSWQLLTEEEQGEYFFEFLADAMLRGDAQARSAYYKGGILDGWLLRNEAREKENLNPIEGLSEPLEPMNMRGAGEEQETKTGGRQRDPRDDDERDRAQRLEAAAAQRVVRKETAAVRRHLDTAAGDGERFRVLADTFYVQHAAFVADVMLTTAERAAQYTQRRREALKLVAGDVPHAVAWISDLEASGADELLALVNRTSKGDRS